MEELVKLVSQRTGLSEEMSRKAVETVIGYLKERLPAPLAGQIDGIIRSGTSSDAADDLMKGLGGLFNKK